ncbi:DUF2806 domain-containing protein [Pseudomonas asiatica]|uniref:DUF2806 domain-containing protein n=1 Tax=Pseudomonas asiatica TaxID=2219225 RepID=UPI0025706722|nr:DUF2806 domain-containing protein [Pseudomonas asiatica]WJD68704.1 DUF2806 domain-containing protein [Pseudomonas asiatica]HDS0929690.1 DUF2806 domain-containing protein [Pseudomonas putida]
MADGNSIINLGDISKPATVLIEKISSAVGIVFEPHRVKRMARAEAEADKIKALARIELTEIEHRAIERFVQQEARKQDNIEQITAQAASILPLDADTTKLDEDWIAHFFKQCDTVSDKEMQSLWARLLSGEATTPGTFSRRTVEFVSTMDKAEAELFTNLCTFTWVFETPLIIITDAKHEIYNNKGISFATLKHLDTIGLISFDNTAGYIRRNSKPSYDVTYFNQKIQLEVGEHAEQLDIGKVLLTNLGRELLPLSGSKADPEYFMHIIKFWSDKEVIISSHLDK